MAYHQQQWCKVSTSNAERENTVKIAWGIWAANIKIYNNKTQDHYGMLKSQWKYQMWKQYRIQNRRRYQNTVQNEISETEKKWDIDKVKSEISA